MGLHVGKTLWAMQQKHYSSGDISIEKIAQCYVEGHEHMRKMKKLKLRLLN